MIPNKSSNGLLQGSGEDSYGAEELRDDIMSADELSDKNQKRKSTVSQNNFSKYFKGSGSLEKAVTGKTFDKYLVDKNTITQS